MKILFISSGNSKNGISSIVRNQGESLRLMDVTIDYFLIKGKGLLGYLNNILKIRAIIRNSEFDIIHAHYSFSAIASTLAGAKPLVVSLMGSDTKLNSFFRYTTKFFHKYFWDVTIIKSRRINESLGLKNVKILPNGVNLEKFKQLNKQYCRNMLGWENNKYHILFPSDPLRFEKNYKLAKNAFDLLLDDDFYQLHCLVDVQNNKVLLHINAADLVLLTSYWEGSPNVIKEAMACNCPIVSTDVGDVHDIIGDTDGCYISTFDPEGVVEKIKLALAFNKRTNGREKIAHLEENVIAEKLIKIYNEVQNGR